MKNRKNGLRCFDSGPSPTWSGGIILDRGDRERLIREKCDHQWQIPNSERSRLSRTTLSAGSSSMTDGWNRYIPGTGPISGRAGPWRKRSPKP